MAEEVNALPQIVVDDDAFAYLKIQRGRLWDLHRDRAKWETAYRASLVADFEDIKPWLHPGKPRAGVLDVGGGLSGIGIMLRRYQPGVPVAIVDGLKDSPKMQTHGETFSNAGATSRFWADNGEASPRFIVPETMDRAIKPEFDLVISLQAWCFHFNPETYLRGVKAALLPGGLMIVDVRKDYVTWRRVLREALEEVGIANRGQKFERVVFRAA